MFLAVRRSGRLVITVGNSPARSCSLTGSAMIQHRFCSTRRTSRSGPQYEALTERSLQKRTKRRVALKQSLFGNYSPKSNSGTRPGKCLGQSKGVACPGTGCDKKESGDGTTYLAQKTDENYQKLRVQAYKVVHQDSPPSD